MRLRENFQQWLFRLGRDEILPIVLTQRRIFILPTRTGLLYGVALIIMLLGAINYNLDLGHALVFLLAGLGIVAMLHTFRNLLGLRLWPGRTESVFVGETAHFTLHLDNPRPYSRRVLSLTIGKNESVSLNIPANEQNTVAVPCVTLRRGRLDPGRVILSSIYPLGLFRAWSYPHPPLSCLVYPRPIETPLPAMSWLQQSSGTQGHDGQEDFSGLRPWRQNESPRRIAWKAVARDMDNRPLLAKRFDGGTAEDLWLDWNLTPPSDDTEKRLSLLAGWVIAAEREQWRYGLRLPGQALAPAFGPAHRNACLEALALYAS